MGEKESVMRSLRKFKKDVKKDIDIQSIILFGSRVKGKEGRDTDVDLVIVSPSFKNLDFFQRGAKMYDYWHSNYPVDFICYTPEEFEERKNQATIVREAIREGVEV